MAEEKNKGVSPGKNKRFKSKDMSIAECFDCKWIDHYKRDFSNRESGSCNKSSANVVHTEDDTNNEEDIFCVSSSNCTEA